MGLVHRYDCSEYHLVFGWYGYQIHRNQTCTGPRSYSPPSGWHWQQPLPVSLFIGLPVSYPIFSALTLTESLLMAAVMSSTDSASVFSILRSKNKDWKEQLRPYAPNSKAEVTIPWSICWRYCSSNYTNSCRWNKPMVFLPDVYRSDECRP